MAAGDILQASQAAFVASDTLGVAEDIVYHHKATCGYETVRAFKEVRKVRGGNTKVIYDETRFSNVSLSVPPAKKDWIVHNGEDYIVDSWAVSAGLYFIVALSNEAFNMKRLTHD